MTRQRASGVDPGRDCGGQAIDAAAGFQILPSSPTQSSSHTISLSCPLSPLLTLTYTPLFPLLTPPPPPTDLDLGNLKLGVLEKSASLRKSKGASPTDSTRRHPPRLPQLAFWLSTSYQGSSTWVGPEIVSTSPMEPTLGMPWDRKVWKDHSLFGLALIKAGR